MTVLTQFKSRVCTVFTRWMKPDGRFSIQFPSPFPARRRMRAYTTCDVDNPYARGKALSSNV